MQRTTKEQEMWGKPIVWDGHQAVLLVFDKDAKTGQGRKGSFFNKQCWNNWASICNKMNTDPHFTSPWPPDLKVKSRTINLGEKIGQNLCDLAFLVLLLSSVDSLWPPWTAARQASLSFTMCQSLLRLMSIESIIPSSHLILCRPLLLLPSIFTSIRVFYNQLALCQVVKVLERQLQHQFFQWLFKSWFPLGLTGLICL